MDLNQQVKSLRKERNISIVGLAKLIGVTPGLLYKIDSGESRGSVSVLERSIKVLGATIIVVKNEVLDDVLRDNKMTQLNKQDDTVEQERVPVA